MSISFDTKKVEQWFNKQLPKAICPMCGTPLVLESGMNVKVYVNRVAMNDVIGEGELVKTNPIMELSFTSSVRVVAMSCSSIPIRLASPETRLLVP